YRASSGKYVISLDDDGQTPADEVDILLNKIIEGYDVVFARYPSKKHSWFKNFGSKINDIMACQLINKPKDLYLSSYFVAKRFVIDTIVAYNNPYPYIGGLLLMTTNKLCNVDVHHRSREIGDSGYTFKKLISLWFNGFTSFSVKPLRISMFFGIIVALLGFILTIYSVIRKIQNPEIAQGWASTMSAITVIGGVILIVLGMIGEYIGRIYISINNFPQYVIKEFKKNKMED
ncbi:MAG: glycosyltransferase, partial [Bacilli bacterium]